MGRLKLALPDFEAIYKTEIPLTVNFINYGGHMGNDAVLTLCHEARLRFLESIGQDELNLFGQAIIQGDSLIIYKTEGHRGNNILIEIFVDDISAYGFDFVYKLTNLETSQELARAKTGMVFYNYDIKKVEKTSTKFRKYFNENDS